MKPKNLAVMAVVLALLAGAYFFIPKDPIALNKPDPKGLKAGERLSGEIDARKAKSLAISKGGKSVKLVCLNEKRWNIATLKDRKAKQEYVEGLLFGIQHAAIERDRPGSLENFGLDEKHRTELEVFDEAGAPIVQLWIGKSAGYEKCFAMLKGGGTAYEIAPDLESAVGMQTEGEDRALNPEYWYDLVICRYKASDAIEFAIKRGHETVRVQKVLPGKGPVEPKSAEELKKEDEAEAKKAPQERKQTPQPVWWITEPEGIAANENNCSAVYNGASELYAQGYADDVKPEDYGLDKPAAKTRVVLRDGTAYAFLLGKRMKEFGILQVEGQPEVWKIQPFTYDAFAREFKDLKKEDTKTQAPPDGTHPPEVKTTAPSVEPAKTPDAVAPPPREEIPDAPPPATKEQLEKLKPKAPPAVLKSE